MRCEILEDRYRLFTVSLLVLLFGCLALTGGWGRENDYSGFEFLLLVLELSRGGRFSESSSAIV